MPMSDRNNELNCLGPGPFLPSLDPYGQHARGETPTRVIAGGEGVYIRTRPADAASMPLPASIASMSATAAQKIADAIAAQAQDARLLSRLCRPRHRSRRSRLAKMIIDRAPKGMSRVYFGLSGSDANETNIKLVWYYNNVLGRPEKKKIISRWRGYHGSGVMTGSLTGLDVFHNAFDLPRAPVLHTEAPYYFRRADRSMSEEQFSQFCADKLEEMILGRGAGYHRRLHRRAGARHGRHRAAAGRLLGQDPGGAARSTTSCSIADEVVTGFGRLGTMFGSDHYGIQPDLITIAKGLTSAYAPLSGVIVSEKVWQVLVQGSDEFGAIGHGWTYSAHPICAAAGVANLELLDELDLVENAA